MRRQVVNNNARTESANCEHWLSIDSCLTARGDYPAAVPRCVPRRPLSPTDAKAKENQLPDVEAHITGTVWKIEVEVGDTVEEGDRW